jgi:hypothetical protein
MAQIFLSYASQDRPRAKAFGEALRDKGWSVFWDRTVPPGKVFDQVIDEALRQASCVVVLWSQASIESNWVKEEITDAAQRGTLIPALIDDVPLPLGFRRLQAARLIGWPEVKDSNEFAQLTASIDGLLATRSGRSAPLPPPAPKPDERWFKATEPVFTVATDFVAAQIPFVPSLIQRGIGTLKALALTWVFLMVGLGGGGLAYDLTREEAAGFAVAIPIWVLGAVVVFRLWRRMRRPIRSGVTR